MIKIQYVFETRKKYLVNGYSYTEKGQFIKQNVVLHVAEDTNAFLLNWTRQI